MDALLYVDATATLGGMDLPIDAWHLDVVSAGLQKCLGGPPGSAPLTLNERAEKRIYRRRHTEKGLQDNKYRGDGEGPIIQSNYFDLAMIMDYWSDKALNHHTEATTMLYAARECARILLQEGLQNAFARHARASKALTEGLRAMGLKLFGDQAHKMPNVTGVYIPQGVDGDAVRRALLEEHNIEIGTSFGPLHGRIWRIGTMGYNAREDASRAEALDAAERSSSCRAARRDAARPDDGAITDPSSSRSAATPPTRTTSAARRRSRSRSPSARRARCCRWCSKENRLLITHGNGPVVGKILLRMMLTREAIPPMRLDVCVAHSQGGIGYILMQALENAMRRAGMPAPGGVHADAGRGRRRRPRVPGAVEAGRPVLLRARRRRATRRRAGA